MIVLKDDNGKKLPKKVQTRVNDFIDNLKNIPWFKPDKGIKKEEVDRQINFTLECFGVKAGIEYKILKTEQDWDSARDSASDSASDSAWYYASDSARDSASDSASDSDWYSAWYSVWYSSRDSSRDSSWDSSWDSSCDSSWASVEILLEDNKDFKKKYPNGAFIQLFKLWEMGLYPCGVINGKFVVYSTVDFWSAGNQCDCDCHKKLEAIKEILNND